jgi:hypothetical protein
MSLFPTWLQMNEKPNLHKPAARRCGQVFAAEYIMSSNQIAELLTLLFLYYSGRWSN